MGANKIRLITYRENLRYLESKEHLVEAPLHRVQYVYITQLANELFNFLGNAMISLHETLLNPLEPSGYTCSVLFNTKSPRFPHTRYILLQYDSYNHHRLYPYTILTV